MAVVYVYVLWDNHSYSLLTPEAALEERAFLRELAEIDHGLAELAEMLPVFGEDGDLLLLASDGQIYGFMHDEGEQRAAVATSFDALLGGMTPGRWSRQV